MSKLVDEIRESLKPHHVEGFAAICYPMPTLQQVERLMVEVERLTAANEVLKSVDIAIRDHHYALDTRQHGGVAQDAAITAIEKALKLPWEPQREKKAREAVRG